MHVSLTSLYYRPDGTGIAPYSADLARHLTERGDVVQVRTGLPHYPAWAVPDGYRRTVRRRERIDGLDVLRLWHHVPAAGAGAVQRSLYELTFGVHNASVPLPADTTVCVVVVPGLASARAVLARARRRQIPVVLWVQDLVAAAVTQSGIAATSWLQKQTARLERAVLLSASQMVVVSDAFREHVRAIGVPDERIHLIRNWSHVEEPSIHRDEIRKAMGWGHDELIVLHSGNMGMKQGLEGIIEVARHVTGSTPPIRFVLMGDGNQRGVLEDAARGAPRLDIVDPVPEHRFTSTLAAADVLLISERPSVIDMSMPSKLTSYLVAGRPVLAVVNPDGATAREVRRTGAGICVRPGEARSALDGIVDLADPQRSAELSEAGRAYAATQFDQATALKRLTDVIEDAHRRRAQRS